MRQNGVTREQRIDIVLKKGGTAKIPSYEINYMQKEPLFFNILPMPFYYVTYFSSSILLFLV